MRVNGRSPASRLLTLAELIVEEELCINLRGRMERCTACKDVCTSAALLLTMDSVDVDGEKCSGCNSCLPSCPAGALRSTGFVPERFLQALSGKDQAHLHCRGCDDEGGGIVIPCHRVLDTRLLASARAEGVKSLILHGLNHCEACKLGDARSHIETITARLEKWLGEEAPVLSNTPQADKNEQRQYQDQPHMNRRDFLRFGGANTVTHAVDWMVPGLGEEEEDQEALPFFQADDYPQRAAQYQQLLVSRADRVPWRNEDALPWKVRTVSEDCNGCLSCGERCPTGALGTRLTSNLRLLSFDPALCTDCSLCQRVCPEKAIIVAKIESLSALHKGRSTLFYRQLQPCKQCGIPFDPIDAEDEICSICGNEQDLDEEWLGMLSG